MTLIIVRMFHDIAKIPGNVSQYNLHIRICIIFFRIMPLRQIFTEQPFPFSRHHPKLAVYLPYHHPLALFRVLLHPLGAHLI